MKSDIDLGPWGVDLDAEALGQVLAALGVTLAADRRRVPILQTIKRAADRRALQRLLDDREAVPWRIAPLLAVKPGTWARVARGLPAEQVAGVWAAAVRDRPSERLPRLAIERFSLDLAPYAALLDLLLQPGVAVAPSILAPELTSPAHWHWPLRVGLFGDAASRAFKARLRPQGWSAPLYRFVELEHETAADIAIMPMPLNQALASLAQLPDVLNVGCIVVLGGLGTASDSQISAIAGALRLGARPWGLAVADVPSGAADQWLADVVYTLSHDATLDLALRASLVDHRPWLMLAEPAGLEATRVTRSAARIMHALPVDLDLTALAFEPTAFGLDPSPAPPPPPDVLLAGMTDPANYRHETDGATATAVFGNEVRIRRQRQAPLAEPRWIQAETRQGAAFRGAPRKKSLLPLTLHGVDIWIGPDVGAVRATETFNEDLLPRDGKSHRLGVVFTELGGGRRTTTGHIVLPATGASDRARFWFRTPADGDFRARIIITFRNRVLQTAMLRAPVAQRAERDRVVEIVVESTPRPGLSGLEGRRSFGAAIVHNHNHAGEASGTMLQGGRAVGLELGGIAPMLARITELLSNAAFDPSSYGPTIEAEDTVKLLFQLAQQGVLLHDDLLGRASFKELVGSAERVQVVAADSNAILPLEFVYDLPNPARPPTLCKNARQALLDGHCDATNHRVNELGLLDVVCPSGFWAVSRVIERHVADPEGVKANTGTAYAVTAEPVRDRNKLSGLTGAVFAASARVDQVVVDSTAKVEAALTKSTGGNSTRVKTWIGWVQAVAAQTPSLLVLLAHSARDDVTGTSALEIEADERAAPGDITWRFIHPEGDEHTPPVVLLLGCDTALADMQYQTFVSRFRQQGAALVVGTLATVAGSHAAAVAQAFVAAIEASDGVPAFGDLLRSIRRRLLADGEVLALALTAYGDADWRFPTSP